MKKLAIFDLDGTVLDTLGSIAYFCNQALNHFNLPENPRDSYKYFAGNGAVLLIHRALAAHNADTEENFEKVFAYYMKEYDGNSAYKTAHFPGLPAVLQQMKDNGMVLAIVSNKPLSTVQEVLPQFFEDGFFQYVHGSGTGNPLKPNPWCVQDIIQKCGVEKEAVLYVGDTATDMETGKNAEVETVGVLWGFRDEEELRNAGADRIIGTPEELLMYI